MSEMELETQIAKQQEQAEENSGNAEKVIPMSIAEKYPQGVNEIIVDFSTAVYQIFVTDEIDKIMTNEEVDGEEANALMELKEYLSELKDVSEVPSWMILTDFFNHTPHLWADILTYIIFQHEDDVIVGEELERRLSYHLVPDTDEEESDSNSDHEEGEM